MGKKNKIAEIHDDIRAGRKIAARVAARAARVAQLDVVRERMVEAADVDESTQGLADELLEHISARARDVGQLASVELRVDMFSDRLQAALSDHISRAPVLRALAADLSGALKIQFQMGPSLDGKRVPHTMVVREG